MVRLLFNITILFIEMKAHSPNHQHDPQSMFEYFPGPVKIKDGLFMGDEVAARVSHPLHTGYRIYHQ